VTAQRDTRAPRTSPEGSSSSEGVPTTPSSNTAVESYPSIVHANGSVEPLVPPQARPSEPQPPMAVHSYHTGHQPNFPPPNVNSYPYPSATQQPPLNALHASPKPANDMQRLEALVAVATSEDNVASAY
jgi:hypothetical protein